MLNLGDVTLLGMDCVNPQRAIHSMLWSMKFVKFAEAVLVTRKELYPIQHKNIRIVYSNQGSRKYRIPNLNRTVALDYELAVLRDTPLYFETSHCLHTEWDSAVLNPMAWEKKWLKYDYIGAPWSEHHDVGWPACDGVTNAVGNGGFSLKSKKLCDEVRNASLRLPESHAEMAISDSWICRTLRPYLETRGFKFAPVKTAMNFSCENRIYSGQFGFHGKITARLNNWDRNFIAW